MKENPIPRRRRPRRFRASATGVGSRCGRKICRKVDPTFSAKEIHALRKRLGIHSREGRFGRPLPYQKPPEPEAPDDGPPQIPVL